MSDLFERILLLKSSPIFREVATEDLRMVAQSLDEELYLSGERVFDIGQQGDHMYIVQSGRVGISLHADPSVRQFVAHIGPGECFGEMNLLDELPRSGTAHIVDDAVLLSLEKGCLRGLIGSYPELGYGMLKGLSLRLRDANLRQMQAAGT